MQTMTETIF